MGPSGGSIYTWLYDHERITFIIIFIGLAYIYHKVFQQRKLPILKLIVMYILLAIGATMLLYFQLLGLPIVLSMGVAVALMLIVRIRYWIVGRNNKSK